MSLRLDDYQVDALLQPVTGARVNRKRNERGQDVSHLEAYDIRRRLTNIFGFGGWSGEVLDMTFMYEGPVEIGENKRAGYEVGYSCTYRLTVHGKDGTSAVYTETAFGDAKMGVTNRGAIYDFAIKTAESQALKRCAINLGDQFGLSLYNKGSLAPLVKYVLGDDPAKWTPEGVIRPKREREKEAAEQDTEPERGEHGIDVTDHVTEQLAPDPEGEADTPAPTDPPAAVTQTAAAGDRPRDVCGEPTDWPDEPCGLTPGHDGDHVPVIPDTQEPPDDLAQGQEALVDAPQDEFKARVDEIIARRQGGDLTQQQAKRELRTVLLDAGKAALLQAQLGSGASLEAYIADANRLVK